MGVHIKCFAKSYKTTHAHLSNNIWFIEGESTHFERFTAPAKKGNALIRSNQD